MAKTVLVTGGAGFIGSHLIERLLGEGDEVICLDNFFTGQRRNIEPFGSDPRFHLMEQDVTTPIDLDRVDQVYNLACPASPPHYQFDPVMTRKTNFMGALNVLELASRTGARVLQASTSEVYGDPLVHPQPEEYRGNVSITGIRSCYDVGKMDAEGLFFDYHRAHNTDIRIIRIFNTYGPRMRPDDGRVVSNFIVEALQDEDITIYGDGSQTRSFQYVDDLVEGMFRMMQQTDIAGPVNLGNPGEFTIRELAEMVLGLIPQSRSRLVQMNLPQDDPQQRRPDTTLAGKHLGWKAEVPLQTGLTSTIDYFREILDQKSSVEAVETLAA
ncbi:NAD-dependent dehydratase [Candidatus Saccharibacteria bacterium]|nr:NAD-dependent dehydratase [Candidatus Saccharibacteria bacterium]MBQ69080.1 NAD-dependent dehydratase [Candidatus Saccharibacteria bacterium]|tara:strand:+ start:95 stop:1075 length:981 start_codon:yes stop_codon:yes gene_type:complete